MKQFNFHEIGLVVKVGSALDDGFDVEITISGWRRKILRSYLKDTFTWNESDFVKPGILGKISYLIRFPWLVPLITIYGVALEKKMWIETTHNSNGISYFRILKKSAAK